jgi:hypothetical protein
MKIAVVIVSVIVLTFAMAAPASAQGCPWCTTPTTCTLVDEHAAGGCKVTAHEGCTSAGVCVINDTYAPTSAAARHFASLGFDNFILLETVEWGEVPFADLGDGRLVLWNCDGEVAAIASYDTEGQILRLDITPYREELNLLALTASD